MKILKQLFSPANKIDVHLLWGYLKAEIVKRRPQTTDELKYFIHHQIAAVKETMSWRALRNFNDDISGM